MQGAKHQVPRFGGSQCQADGFGVAHLAHQNNIGVFTQGGAQGVGEAVGVFAQFALVHKAFFGLVHKLDGVFNGEDVGGIFFVHIVHHGGKGGGFARTCWPCYQHQTAWVVGDFLENARGFELFQG